MLSVNYQSYNTSVKKLIVYKDKLFIDADLSHANGKVVSYFGLTELNINNENSQFELEIIFDKISNYLKGQVPLIIDLLENRYRLKRRDS